MRNSLPSSSQQRHSASTDNCERRISGNRQQGLFDRDEEVVPGTINDAAMIRATLTEAIRKSGKSREQIAESMSRLTGTQVTVRRLNAFTAESREDFRFPLELTRAFCMATEDFTLLRNMIEMAGFRVVTKTEFDVLKLGHEYLTQKRATENMRMLEARLAGKEL